LRRASACRTRLWSALVVLSAHTASSGCATTPGARSSPTPLMDRSFVAPTIDRRDSTIFEAQVATPLFLYDELVTVQRRARYDSSSLEPIAKRVVIVPMFRVRQLRDSSAAVRTPSFNPSIIWERHRFQIDTVNRVSGSVQRDIRAIGDRGWRLEWTHHSNGQAGCFLAGYVPAPSGNPDDCAPGPDADTTGIGLNRANGDFSTTYWGVSRFYRRVHLNQNHDEVWSWGVALGYQLHRFGIFGDMRQQQRELYGTHRGRVTGSISGQLPVGEVRADALWEIAERTDRRIERWRGHVDLSYKPRGLFGAGVLVRLHDGQDYYNIGFVQRRTRILFGILLDPSGREEP